MGRHRPSQNPTARATRFSPPTHGTRRQHGPAVPHRHVRSASPRRCSQTKNREAEQVRSIRNPRGEGSAPTLSTKLQVGTQSTRDNQNHGARDVPPVAARHLNRRKGVQAPVLALFSLASLPSETCSARTDASRFPSRKPATDTEQRGSSKRTCAAAWATLGSEPQD